MENKRKGKQLFFYYPLIWVIQQKTFLLLKH